MISFPSYVLPFISTLISLLIGYQEPGLFSSHPVSSGPFNPPPQEVSIADLLGDPQTFHEQRISVRGLVTQPELHLDESELYLDFVFRLSQGSYSIIVYGRHDRTQGAPAMSMNAMVEVTGTFLKEQNRNGSSILNTLEAISVMPFPSSIPGST